MKSPFLMIFLSFSLTVFSQSDAKGGLLEVNKKVVAAYREGKLNDALRYAQEAVDLAVRTHGEMNVETATAYFNLGVIQREKSKTKEAMVSLSKAISIYENLKMWTKVVSSHEAVAIAHLQAGDGGDSETSFHNALQIAEREFGNDSKEMFSPMLSLASTYARNKKFERADEYYLRSVELAVKAFGKDSNEIKQIDDSRACLIAPPDQSREAFKKFQEEKKRILGIDSDSSDIVNGKALSLPKPRYPVEARSQRLGGTIAVRVKIDESGNVMSAKAICGHAVLREVSEESARSAKFTPTVKDGKARVVDGIITYRFVP